MAAKRRIAIVGVGKVGSALAASLQKAGYHIDSMMESEVVWLCVPDSQIAAAAENLASALSWKGRIALHSSGVLGSDELKALRRRGASVASVHPLMTFVRNSRPALTGVPFAIEGDAAAVRTARRIVKGLGGTAHTIRKQDKAAYHAWATFASPLLTAFLATTEHVAAAAGVRQNAARKRMLPILRQTLANYMDLPAEDAFSGPIIRGDVETVTAHLRVLRKIPAAREVYVALGRAALEYLPAKNVRKLRKLLK